MTGISDYEKLAYKTKGDDPFFLGRVYKPDIEIANVKPNSCVMSFRKANIPHPVDVKPFLREGYYEVLDFGSDINIYFDPEEQADNADLKAFIEAQIFLHNE